MFLWWEHEPQSPWPRMWKNYLGIMIFFATIPFGFTTNIAWFMRRWFLGSSNLEKCLIRWGTSFGFTSVGCFVNDDGNAQWVLSLQFLKNPTWSKARRWPFGMFTPQCDLKTCTWQSFRFLAGCFWDATAVWPEGVGDEYHHPGTGTKLRLVDLATTCVAHKADARPIIEKSRKIDNRFFLQT